MGGKRDKSEQIAREAEARRQAAISEGRAAIDENFAKFDDPFFGRIRQTNLNFFNDEINRQLQAAQRNLVLNLSRTGTLNSSAGARQLADLRAEAERQRGLFGDRAIGAENEARGDVERNRAELVNQLNASADPAAAAEQAIARADLLSQPREFDQVGDLFGALLNTGAQAVSAIRENRLRQPTGTATNAKGSARIVT